MLVARALAQLRPGDRLNVAGHDPALATHLEAWCRGQGHQVRAGDDGALLGKHRKLVPTWAEKLTWAHGDGSSLQVHRTDIGPLGVLACGENTNTLARFTLLAQGELVHVANYIALPVAPADYDMVEAIKVRSAAHAFEGKVFNIVACSTVSPEIIDMVAGPDDAARTLLSRPHSAFSGIFGPDGRLIGDGLIDEGCPVCVIAQEICDGRDNDCDGQADNGASDAPEWARDADADGATDPSDTVRACVEAGLSEKNGMATWKKVEELQWDGAWEFAKQAALEAKGVPVGTNPTEAARIVVERLGRG